MSRFACYMLALWLLPLWEVDAQLNQSLRMDRKLSVTWKNKQLGSALERIRSTQQIAIWLDRRINPHQKINLDARHVSLLQIFESISEQQNIGYCQLGNILYIGPKDSAAALPSLSQSARDSIESAHPSLRRRWSQPRAFSWQNLSEPRKILSDQAKSLNLKITDLEKIPHDLWYKNELPPTSFLEQTVLVLLGFDLCCEISKDGTRFKITSIKRPIPTIRNQTRKKAVRIPKSGDNEKSKQVYSLKIENQPLGVVISQLARQLNLTVKWDKRLILANPKIRDRMISCDLHQLDESKLIDGILQPAGIIGKISNSQLTILPGPE